MIHIIMGTKAQLIKMVAIIKSLEKHNIEYNYIDTCQHQEITKKLREQLKIREPDYSFNNSNKNVTTNSEGIIWMFKIFFQALFNLKKIFKNDKGGLCLVHGDTVSTFLGAIIGKMGKQKIVHVEAGFRTPTLLKPFPEEIIRRLVDRWSFINFALSDEAMKNLQEAKFKGKNYNLKENTLIDSVNIAKNQVSEFSSKENFILVSIHRYETIHSRKRMKFIVDTVINLSKSSKIVWGLHAPTKKSLIRFGLLKHLKDNKNIQLRKLFDYFDFINAISKSSFLITDGGGPQEETKYLNIPCLLMRTENERPENTHIYQSEFKKDRIDYFLTNINKFQAEPVIVNSPSEKITEIILNSNA